MSDRSPPRANTSSTPTNPSDPYSSRIVPDAVVDAWVAAMTLPTASTVLRGIAASATFSTTSELPWWGYIDAKGRTTFGKAHLVDRSRRYPVSLCGKMKPFTKRIGVPPPAAMCKHCIKAFKTNVSKGRYL